MAVKTIVLRGRGIRKEAPAGGAVTPGHLVMRNSSSQFVVHGTAAANAAKNFAVENELIGNGIDVAYAANDQLLVEACYSGMEVNALVAAAAAAIAIGDPLESAGDGTLRLAATAAATTQAQRDGIIGYALEAVDNSGGGTTARIKVEIA